MPRKRKLPVGRFFQQWAEKSEMFTFKVADEGSPVLARALDDPLEGRDR